jgi:hypothetical protein
LEWLICIFAFIGLPLLLLFLGVVQGMDMWTL